MAIQLNYPKSNNRFITINYQSNDYLNEEFGNKVKLYIAKILVEKFDIKNIHSYVHGQIIIEVSSTKIVVTLKKIVTELAQPLASHAPSLLYSVDLVANSGDTPPINFIYVSGDDDMNQNFLKSIKEFYP